MTLLCNLFIERPSYFLLLCPSVVILIKHLSGHILFDIFDWYINAIFWSWPWLKNPGLGLGCVSRGLVNITIIAHPRLIVFLRVWFRAVAAFAYVRINQRQTQRGGRNPEMMLSLHGVTAHVINPDIVISRYLQCEFKCDRAIASSLTTNKCSFEHATVPSRRRVWENGAFRPGLQCYDLYLLYGLLFLIHGFAHSPTQLAFSQHSTKKLR